MMTHVVGCVNVLQTNKNGMGSDLKKLADSTFFRVCNWEHFT